MEVEKGLVGFISLDDPEVGVSFAHIAEGWGLSPVKHGRAIVDGGVFSETVENPSEQAGGGGFPGGAGHGDELVVANQFLEKFRAV